MDEKILEECSPSWSASRPRGASWWGRMLRRLPSWGSSCVCILYLSRRRDWSRWRRGCAWRSRPTQCSRAVLGKKMFKIRDSEKINSYVAHTHCSHWLSLLSSWLVIWSVVHFVRAGSRGRPRGQGCRASSPGWTPVEPAAHIDQSSWPWSWSSWKLWAEDLTETTQASRLLVLLLLVAVLGKGRLYLALEEQPWWALFSPQLSTKQIPQWELHPPAFQRILWS